MIDPVQDALASLERELACVQAELAVLGERGARLSAAVAALRALRNENAHAVHPNAANPLLATLPDHAMVGSEVLRSLAKTIVDAAPRFPDMSAIKIESPIVGSGLQKALSDAMLSSWKIGGKSLMPRKTKDAILDVLGFEAMSSREVLDAIEARGWLDPDIQRPINAISTALLRMSEDPESLVEKHGEGYRRKDAYPSGAHALNTAGL